RAGVERTPCLRGGVLETHESPLRLASAVVNYAEGALHLIVAASAKRYCTERLRGRPAELNQGILGLCPLEGYGLVDSSLDGQADVDGTLDLAQAEGDQPNDESRVLHPHRKLREPLDQPPNDINNHRLGIGQPTAQCERKA